MRAPCVNVSEELQREIVDVNDGNIGNQDAMFLLSLFKDINLKNKPMKESHRIRTQRENTLTAVQWVHTLNIWVKKLKKLIIWSHKMCRSKICVGA